MPETLAAIVPRSTSATARSRRRPAILVATLFAMLLMLRLTGCVESAFYHPDRSPFLTPAGYEDVSFATTDGLTLRGWFCRGAGALPGEVRPVIIHAHGNAGNIASHAGFSEFLPTSGCHVLMFDYRGYGRSDASPRALRRGALLADTLAAVDYAQSRSDVAPDRVGMYGVSLGAAFAYGAMAARSEIKAIATCSAFSSWAGIASDHVPVLGRLLVARGVDPVDDVKLLAGRALLIVHGQNDDIVAVKHAAVIAEAGAASGQVETMIVPGAGHNDITESRAVKERLVEFFGRVLRGAGVR